MSDRRNGRVSMFAPTGVPVCDTCQHLTRATGRNGGWCSHPSNRTEPSSGWPTGFTPSVAWHGSCELHPERRAALADTAAPQEQPR